MTPDVNVVLLDFPAPGNEMVFENEDDSFTIMINARLSYDEQLKAYRHAMRHIENDDFQKENVQTIEAAAHAVITIPVETQPMSAKRFLQRLKKIQAEQKRIQKELKQLEEHLEVVRSMKGFDDFELADSQQWYGSSL